MPEAICQSLMRRKRLEDRLREAQRQGQYTADLDNENWLDEGDLLDLDDAPATEVETVEEVPIGSQHNSDGFEWAGQICSGVG